MVCWIIIFKKNNFYMLRNLFTCIIISIIYYLKKNHFYTHKFVSLTYFAYFYYFQVWYGLRISFIKGSVKSKSIFFFLLKISSFLNILYGYWNLNLYVWLQPQPRGSNGSFWGLEWVYDPGLGFSPTWVRLSAQIGAEVCAVGDEMGRFRWCNRTEMLR